MIPCFVNYVTLVCPRYINLLLWSPTRPVRIRTTRLRKPQELWLDPSEIDINFNLDSSSTDSSSTSYSQIHRLTRYYVYFLFTHILAVGAILTSQNHPKCEFNSHFGWFGLVKIVPTNSDYWDLTVHILDAVKHTYEKPIYWRNKSWAMVVTNDVVR